MSVELYKELSATEQIKVPTGRIGYFLFASKLIFTTIWGTITRRKNLTNLESQLIADKNTFFDHHIQKHSKYEDFGEYGEIYNLVIPKHDEASLDPNNKGPVLVFIHGLGGNLHQFDEQFNHFYQKYDVVSFDLPGSGNSSLKSSSYVLSLNNFTRFVIEFLEFKGLIDRDLILIGHSYGTQVAFNLFQHLNSKQIKKIILIAPPKFPALRTFGTNLVLKSFYYIPVIFEIFRKFDRINNIESASLRRLFSSTKFDEIDDFLKFKQLKFNLQTNSQNFINHIVNWKPMQLDELIAAVNHLKTSDDFKDILIIDGSEDKVTRDGGSSYKAVLGDLVDYKVIEKAGHNLLLDSYKELNETLEHEVN
jgi:pimeloyl-ACP methyl ester carboxylesterase